MDPSPPPPSASFGPATVLSTKPTEPVTADAPAQAGGEASGLNIDESLIESNWDTVTDK